MAKSWLPPVERAKPAKAAPLGPLLAGARARGVADGFSWLGLAAILIDDRGEALHVNPGAVELMGEALYLQNNRLRARDPADDRALADALRDALALGQASNLQLRGRDGEVWAHVAPMPADPDDPFQLLSAVAILSATRQGGPARH